MGVVLGVVLSGQVGVVTVVWVRLGGILTSGHGAVPG
jgi:hypothetical protein